MSTFDPDDSVAAVELVVDAEGQRLREQLAWETTEALRCASEYARHLAAGGDPAADIPKAQPNPKHLQGNTMVSAVEAMQHVYGDWNAARAWPNPFSPFWSRRDFLVAEYAMTRVGRPMLYADIVAAVGGKPSSDDIASALAAIQGDDLVLRRTKVEGKVAYLLRPRHDGEEMVGSVNEGNHRRPVSAWASDVPEEKAALAAT